MRLIDADKLEAYGTTVPKECNAEDYLCGARDVLEHIDSMPTVEAIPIEFIRKWILAQGYGRQSGWFITLRNFEKLIKDWEADNNHGTS